MGIEEFKQPEKIEDVEADETEKAEDKTKPEEPTVSRRGFLKAMAVGAGALASGKVVDAAEKLTGYDYHKDPRAREEIRKTREDLRYREDLNNKKSPDENFKIIDSSKSEAAHEKKPEKKEDDQKKSGHITERMEKWSGKWENDKTSEAIKRIKPQENMGPHDIAKEMLRLFDTDELKRFFPGEVFSSDFFIAQTFQESRGKKEVTSSTGARGVMQNFPGSVIDAIVYLDAMRSRGLIPYRGPSKIKDRAQAAGIIEYFTKNVNYGRAAGKIYEQAIFNPIYKFNTKPNENIFRGKSSREMQRLVLISYHDGPPARYKSDRELIAAAKNRARKSGKKFREADSAVYYYKKIFMLMDLETQVKKLYKNKNLILKYEDMAVDRMLHVMERHNFSKSKLKEQTLLFIGKLDEKKKELGRDLSRGEIMDVFRPYI